MTFIDPKSENGQQMIRDTALETPPTQGDPPPEPQGARNYGCKRCGGVHDVSESCQVAVETPRPLIALSQPTFTDWEQIARDYDAIIVRYRTLLSPETVENFICSLNWGDDAPDIWKTLVAGNIRGFAAFARQEEPAGRSAVQSEPDRRCLCGHKRGQHGVIKTATCYECECEAFRVDMMAALKSALKDPTGSREGGQ